VSHEHYDHFSKPDIKAISTPKTVIVTSEDVSVQLSVSGVGCKEIIALAPGKSIDLSGVKIEAVASYNINKRFHPKHAANLGFVVTMDGVSVYHAGDTDLIPEMDGVKCDVALLPVGGTYLMNADEAAQAALLIKPKVAIPMHYSNILGMVSETRRFENSLKGKIEVKILRKEE
jgi:L-ascorbate metabolism protein UlaG (beta-lactamase superfamily)